MTRRPAQLGFPNTAGRTAPPPNAGSPLRPTPLAVLLVCGGLLWAAQECQALTCLEEMIIAGVDQHDDWGCVVDVTPDGRA
jgi:hypothetical protein